eukprot:scaffold1172_cov115-Cylindrotheca_fusiformis.AAC.5
MSRFFISIVAVYWLLNVASAALSSSSAAGEPWPQGELNCAQGFRKLNKITQKQTYYVGIHAPAGVETAYREHNMTFDRYLNEVVGKRWDPPIEFKIKVTDDPLRDWIDYGEEVDFMYTDTGIFSCIGIEIGAQPIGTTISRLTSRGRDYTLDVFAGTMMVLKTNRDINSVQDLKDKVIGAQAFSDFAGAQAQFYVMRNKGLDYIMDPKQVIFTGNNGDTVQGILDGRWDVGFVRTGQAHRIIDPATGDYVDPSVFKVLDPRIYFMDSGEQFPFLHSTPVFPEWTLSAKDDVDRIVSEEVAKAMMNFQYHNSIGVAIQNCREEATTPEAMNLCDTMPPVYFDPKARCDTTRELAELAREAGIAGFHNGLRSPRSYYFVRTMQQDAGFVAKDEYGKQQQTNGIVLEIRNSQGTSKPTQTGNWHCERATSLYDGIICPDGHYKVREEDFKRQCVDAGTPCPDGYHCYCKPCIKAFDVSIFPVSINSDFDRDNGCQKMGLCGEVEQTKPIRLQARDNLERNNVEVTALVRLGRDARPVSVTEVEKYLYEFQITHEETGVAIVEVYVDGVQIPESPIRVEITPRDCGVDFPGKGKIPNAIGKCECPSGTVEVQDSCASTDTFEVSIAPWIVNGIEVQMNASEITGCNKMSLCGSVEQTREIRFYAFDNRLRGNATLAALMHIGQDVRELAIRQVQPYLYEFGFSNSRLGVAILEILVNGIQIRESPIRVEISPRDCNVEYPHQNKVPVRNMTI